MTATSPYPGLRPFQPEEAHLFFGREAQVEDMLSRLEVHRFLAVVGTSGCGKSSLVRAGLIPALKQGFLSDAQPHWRLAIARPGSAPFDNLTTALLQESALGPERRGDDAGALLETTLRRGPLGLLEAVVESNLPEGTNLLVLVDQFEEIFRYRQQAPHINDADAFVSLLLAAAQSQQPGVPIYVVITMRSDYIGDCALFTDLPEAINDSQFLTPRLTRDQYQAAIVEPARVAKGQLSDALVNRLLNDLRGEPDQLPVLQHVLMRMWTQASGKGSTRELTLLDYDTTRGLAGALSQHCDEILAQGLNPDQQRIAEIMFRALCERGSDQRDTRRPVKLEEVAAIAGVEVDAVKPVVDAFRGEGRNFLMPPISTPLAAGMNLDISHESLIRHWQTLNTWLEAEAESARQYQRLEDAAKRRQEWEGAELWRGVDLHNAQQWKERERPTAVWAARYGDAYPLAMDFLEQSEAEEKAQQLQREQDQQRELEQARELAEAQKARADEQARAAKRFQRVAIVIGVLLLATVGIAIYANYQQNIAAKAQEQAEKDQRQAEHERKRAQEEEEKARLAAVDAKRHQQRAEIRLARYFSAVSKPYAKSKPPLGVLFSLEAVKASPIPAAEEALRHALENIGGTPLVGHEGSVSSVAFSPDGQHLASASDDNTVRLWKTTDATAAPTIFRGHEGYVNSVAFSPDGQHLASASSDRTVRLWNTNIGNLMKIACHFTGRNFSNKEWQSFLVDEPYRKTCLNLPLSPDFVITVREEVEQGRIEVKDAMSKVHHALEPGDETETININEAKRLVAPALLARGQKQAQSGKIEDAITLFKNAIEFDPNLSIDPEYANYWNALCWFGALDGFAADVLEVCETAVKLAPDHGGIRDSRGVARALAGNHAGAIEDFKFFVQWAPIHDKTREQISQREAWITQLHANQNPFTAELLKQLRNQ